MTRDRYLLLPWVTFKQEVQTLSEQGVTALSEHGPNSHLPGNLHVNISSLAYSHERLGVTNGNTRSVKKVTYPTS